MVRIMVDCFGRLVDLRFKIRDGWAGGRVNYIQVWEGEGDG